MAAAIAERVRRRREALRRAGLRPIQIWAPDSRKPGFAEECRRQVRRIAESDRDDELDGFLEGALRDVANSGEWK